jgi:FOG: HEAT repeat
MGKRAEKAIPTLKLLLKSDRSELRFAAAKAVATIDRGDAELLTVIEEMLSHESPQVRGDGGRALGQLGIGDPTDRVLKMLLKAAMVGDENVRSGLAYSLVRMNQARNRELLPTLTALLVKNERTSGLEHELAQAIINLLDDPRAGGT